MIKLNFYTTEGCHLCEDAQRMLETLAETGLCEWLSVEIARDDQLSECYGIRIPVIGKTATKVVPDELGWPFTLKELREWL